MPRSLPPLTQPATLDLKKLNQRFEKAHPRDILAWGVVNLPTGLIQISSFDVDDLVITDLLYRALRPPQPVPVLFVNTLHHFSQTLQLVAQATAIYDLNLKVYKPANLNSQQEFTTQYGKALWEKNPARFYELTRIEPLQRGLADLGAIAWITGCRRDQSPASADLPIFALDQQRRLRVNPLANWSRRETWAYVFEHDMVYNPLHDRGYPCIGDKSLVQSAPARPIGQSMPVGKEPQATQEQERERIEYGIHGYLQAL